MPINYPPVANSTNLPDTSAPLFLSTISAYTGGGSAALDGINAASIAVPFIVEFIHPTDRAVRFLLRAGTDAVNSPYIIRPADYNGSTNAKVFERI